MREKTKLQPDNPEQSAKFIEAAEKLELLDNPEEAFDRMVRKVVKAGRVPRQQKDSKPR